MKKILLVILIGLLTACSANDNKVDLATWNDTEVYSFLNEVQQGIGKVPAVTRSKDHVIEQYELYFSPELSKEIVNSLYIKTEDGWMIPDGDAGYIFTVPSRGAEGSEVTITYTKDFIVIKEVFQMGMFREIEYTIRNLDNKPIITEWKRVFD